MVLLPLMTPIGVMITAHYYEGVQRFLEGW